ncbi:MULTISPECIES: GNAT family N-acetyltransferase [Salinivibrio]|uniref:GNAT family N-acetyltransferase n=1 Tax=Salinivibrio proteolyticus TaxID=334715 RepID=A0ABY7LC79_9GAMM|nr:MULTISPECIES: GNAT family N-acetyltransferase [Salinivibrio]ODQ01146.1 biphenyl 2,3-dioxygenase [Salinivibrio sp. DV]OOF08480.1 biphenyl 2,3-dioxygenase [Salinivibrio sp. PR5]OOF11126.1 biphenyl 2,3-dioxygenase [Salinivibrio sp. PR919]OOF13854.1 biphenyl 2,3-dioxygenase [Salinivibrio sp. PR932]OOF25243.1 biphenyl 2,3-dioxygenase [Salinivibrio proteolyticus]
MKYRMDANPSDDDITAIRQGLKQSNHPFLAGIPEGSLAGYAFNDHDERVGGIIANTWGQWLLIKYLWVDDAFRQRHVGSHLLSNLEEYGKEVGCKMAFVDTFSFQAKPFYEKHGYQCQMTLDDYPLNHSLHFMTKKLAD